MTIIVTGGAGFIGSNFIYFELKNHPEDRIVCLDALTYAGNLATLEPAMKNSNFRFVKGDITDRACVTKLFEEEKTESGKLCVPTPRFCPESRGRTSLPWPFSPAQTVNS